MSFLLNEEEYTPYGTPILKRIDGVETIGKLIQAVERLNAQAGGNAFTWIMGDEKPVGIISATAGPSGLVLNATPEGVMPPPVKSTQFVKGLRIEAHGAENQAVFVKYDGDGGIKKIKSARLEILDTEDPLHIITLEPGEIANIQTSRDADTDAPYNSEDIESGLAKLSAASRRPNLAKEPLFCHIPSIRNKYVQDDTMADSAGTLCVIDVVRKKENHLEIDLMSVSPQEAERTQEEPGDQSAEAVAQKCSGFGKGLPLFFIYAGKPYAASEFRAEDGRPPVMTLEPWAEVDEDSDSGEIRTMAAEHMANGLI